MGIVDPGAKGRRGLVLLCMLLGAVVLVLAVITVMLVVGGASEDDEFQEPSPAATVPVDVLEAAFADGSPLGDFMSTAESLEDAVDVPDPVDRCTSAASELDVIGTPDELAVVVAELGDDVVEEAAFEQQAAVSSLFAACRGDAPASLEEATVELAMSNDALTEVLAERGLR